MDNHLYILFIRQLLPCQIVKLSLVKHSFNQITCYSVAYLEEIDGFASNHKHVKTVVYNIFPDLWMRSENRNCWICELILQRINLRVPNLVHAPSCGSHWDLHCPPRWYPCACSLRGLSCAEYTALGITQVRGPLLSCDPSLAQRVYGLTTSGENCLVWCTTVFLENLLG